MRISIDCWGTLIKSSPTFSQKKIELVKKYFPEFCVEGISDCFDDLIASHFLITKKVFNDVIENSGGFQPSIEYIFTYLLTQINGGYSKLNFLEDFIHDYQKLAITDHPIPYSEYTIHYIEKLSREADLIISSNTMLISGNTLITCLDRIGLIKFFQDAKFSNMMRVAKPHKSMYSDSNYHIGDNPITDGIGATHAGSTPIIINSTDLTIKDAYDVIVQGR